MSEEVTPAAAPEAAERTPPAPEPQDEAKPKTLDQLLANLDEDQRRIIQGEIGKARTEAKNLRERVKAAEPKASEFDKVVEAQKTSEQRAEERAAAAERELSEMRMQVTRSEIRALAAEKNFIDPDDANRNIDPTQFLNDAGQVDVAAVRVALDELAAQKDYLVKHEEGPRNPAPNRAQGTSGNGRAEAPVSPGRERMRYAYGMTAGK